MAPRILIADDNESLGVALQGLLGKKGLDVDLVKDGPATLARVMDSPPDVLVLDLKLPGLHGIEVLRKIRTLAPLRNLPVVIITGAYSEQKYKNAASKLNPLDYLVKPFRTDDLLKAIQKGLRQAEASRAPFHTHLLAAFSQKFSGRCILTRPPLRTTLRFFRGMPQSIQPGLTDNGLADYLLQKGLISELERDFFQTSPGDPALFVRMGCLSFEELREEERSYLENELIEAFALAPMEAEFIPEDPPNPGRLFNLPALLYAGFSRHPNTRGQQALFEQHRHCFVAPSKEFFQHINFLRLSEAEKLFLKKMDGHQLLAECQSEDAELLPLFQTVHCLGMLQLDTTPLTPVQPEDLPIRTLFNDIELPPPEEEETLETFADWMEEDAQMLELEEIPLVEPEEILEEEDRGEMVRELAESLRGKNHYEIFGITPDSFSIDALREAYFGLTRRLGTETLMLLGGEDATLAQETLATLANAYNNLSDGVSRERYDALLRGDSGEPAAKNEEQMHAQVRAQAAKVFIEKKDWENAEKALQDACNIEPKNADYLAHLAWAIFNNPRNARSETLRRKAVQIVNRALTLERSADAFAIKGWMLLESGQENLAETEFNKGLKLNPLHSLGRRGLQALKERRDQKNRGIFRKLFG